MNAEKWSYFKFVKYVMPSILSMVFISLYTIIDGLFVARYVGTEALAAVNLVFPIYNIGFGIIIMLAVGASALISIALGESKKDLANNYFSLISIVIFITTVIIAILGVLNIDLVLKVLGVTSTLQGMSRIYGTILFIAVPFLGMKVSYEYFLRVDDHANLSLLITVVGGLINIILDYVFVAKLNLGIAGAGYATLLGIIVPSFVGIYHFIKNPRYIHYVKPKLDLKFLLDASINGSSEMVTEFSGAITAVLFNVTLLKYAGSQGVAANSVMMYILFLVISIGIGMTMGIQPLVSFNYGAKNYASIRNVLTKAYLTITGLSIGSFVVLQLFNEQLVSLFLKDDISTSIIATNGLRIFAFAFLLNSINILSGGYFTAVNNGKISALISFSRSIIILVPAILILSNLYELNGIWLAKPITEAITIVIVGYFLFKDEVIKKTLHYNKMVA